MTFYQSLDCFGLRSRNRLVTKLKQFSTPNGSQNVENQQFRYKSNDNSAFIFTPYLI